MNTWLAHHGILGQKWGVRRFQNPDGTLTAEGKKRYAKDLSKQYYAERKQYSRQPLRVSDNFREKNKQQLMKVITDEDVVNVNEKLSKLKDIWKKQVSFDDSEERSQAEKRAYDKCYEWFKKNEPEYLEDAERRIKNGEALELSDFHDFRKTLEGWEDEELSKAEKQYYETHKNQRKLSEQEQKAWKEYRQECRKVTHKILGEYGDQIRVHNSGSSYTLNELINESLYAFNWDEFINQKN